MVCLACSTDAINLQCLNNLFVIQTNTAPEQNAKVTRSRSQNETLTKVKKKKKI